jgi:hypothetical protein
MPIKSSGYARRTNRKASNAAGVRNVSSIPEIPPACKASTSGTAHSGSSTTTTARIFAARIRAITSGSRRCWFGLAVMLSSGSGHDHFLLKAGGG